MGVLDSINLLDLCIEMQICIPRSSEVAWLWNTKHLTEMLVQVLRGAPSPSFARCCRWTGAWPWWLQIFLQILLIEDLQSSGSLLFRDSILDWGWFKFVRCSFFNIGCFIFHLIALTIKKQITSLDCEGCKMEGREPHWGWRFVMCCVLL